jgi:hypothetical protein
MLQVDVFTYTLITTIPSIYGIEFGMDSDFPNEKKGEAHNTLWLMFARNGLPRVLIMDGWKKQILG